MKNAVLKESGVKFTVKVVDNKYYLLLLNKDVEFGIDDLETLVHAEKEIGGQKLPVLVICPPSATTNVELLQALSKNQNNPYSSADAFVISSIAQKILANFYLKINKPERPTRFFNVESEAREWLKQFMQ
ncbi:MAG: hypothetical protein JST26_16280 [Bacteroidetes bacterium]|nr:hypothetical protein [Bacteroidota bacterium]